MSEPLVLALVGDAATGAALALGFEEEGVPLTVALAHGPTDVLARRAAAGAVLGIGVGGSERLAVVLAGASGRPYLEASAAAARSLGRDAARIAARRPLNLG